MRKALVLFFLALLMAECFAVLESDSIKVFAVTDNGSAISADLSLTLKSGTGKVWTSVEPLVGTSTQSTEKLAVETARDYSRVVDSYDYFFEINSNASLVEGPSAGAAMTLLVISVLQDKQVPDDVALTGTITAEGGVGAVGGVFEKSKEAAKVGIKLFMIPSGESRQTVKIDDEVRSISLVDYAESNWGLKVIEVKNIDEVLNYAFQDIGSIDVNTGNGASVEFVPKKIALAGNLKPMKALTEGYISDAEDALRSAKTALSGTMLNDPVLLDMMLTNLNESEKTLAKSKILFEQNYLYSAANYAFLAKVNSGFVRDIAENPALLSRNSTVFDGKISELDSKVNSLAFDLNRFVTVDYFEWHVAAKERLTWAKLKLDGLKASNELTIVAGQDGVDWQRVSGIMDYEYAVAWHSVAKDFFELTKDSRIAIIPDSSLLGTADSFIANAENGLSALSEEESEDIARRLDSAKLARASGWVYTSLYDSGSALALSNAVIFSKNRSLDELQAALEKKASELEAKLSQSGRDFVWARLYLDHAKYYLDASAFYKVQGQPALALDNAKSGIELAFLAEGVFESAEISLKNIEALPKENYVEVGAGWQEKPSFEGLSSMLLVVLAVSACAAVFVLVASGRKFHLLKPFSFEDKLDDILVEQRNLRKRLERGHISKEQFEALNAPLQGRLNSLLLERKAISADYLQLDLNRTKVLAFGKALVDLERQRRKKQITLEDYASSVSFYRKRIALLKHLVAEGERKIALEKKQAEKEFSGKKAKKKPA